MKKTPQHIAIIMDGNGRWAESKNLSRFEGHKKGSQVAEEVVDVAVACGIKYLTLYTFSDENWVRPDDEIQDLMALLGEFLETKCEKMLKNGVRFTVIGEVSKLPMAVIEKVRKTEEATSHCDNMTLVLALSYGSRQEICRAVTRAIKKGAKEITSSVIDENLDTANIPDPDLLIRTSGEFRISNFLLWQLSYTELYFTDVLWPDFNKEEFKKAINAYQVRERRFGGR